MTAKSDLPAGTSLTAQDLRQVRFTDVEVPAGAITESAAAIGRRLAGAVRRGEPLTDVRLDDAGALANPGKGLVATAVRLADTRAAALLQPGMRIDVLAASSATVLDAAEAAVQPAAVVAHQVTVIAVPTSDAGTTTVGSSDSLDDQDGALVVLATTPAQARVLAQAQVSDRLSAVSLG